MPSIKFTARSVDAIRSPAGGQVDYWDQSMPGFGLRVSAAGRKSWIAMYRHEGLKRRMTIGTYPALKLTDARGMAGDILRDAGRGLDPASTKRLGARQRHSKNWLQSISNATPKNASVHGRKTNKPSSET